MTGRGGNAIVLALVVLALGCESRLALGASCVFASDCPEPYACLAGRCRTECVEARDCPYPLECYGLGGGVSACRVGEDATCRAGASDCAAPLVCDASGVCRQPCTTAEVCPAGLSCGEQGCETPPPLVGSAACDPTSASSGCASGSRCALSGASFACVATLGAATLGAACTGDTCGEGLVCAGGRCVRVCRLGCGEPGCAETSCGADLYCSMTAIGLPEGELPPTLPDGLAYCSERCDVYGTPETDRCPEGTACGIAFPRADAKYECRSLRSTGLLAPYDDCDGDFGGCPFGTICEITSGSGSPPRLCREFCHPGSTDECADGRPCNEIDGLDIGVCGDL